MNNKLLGGILALLGGSILLVSFITGKKMKLKKNARLLFIGDSYTAGNTSYADQLKKSNPDLQINKIAKVGEKTDWMLQNAHDDLSSNNYDAVFILGGINDVYALNSITNAKKNLQSMYNLAKNSGMKVIGVTIAPTDSYPPYTDELGKLTNDLNSWILNNKTLDSAVDFNKMLKKNGKQDLNLFVSDKLHANSSAHKTLADTIEKNMF
jgi:lysophospholipase L1-like esterase